MYDDRTNLLSIVIMCLILATSVISWISFSYNAEAQTFGDNEKITVPRDGQIQEMNVMVGSRPYLLLSSITSASSSPTNDILTYQNSSYGIRIQYPANWTKDEGDFDPNDGVTNIVEFSSPLTK